MAAPGLRVQSSDKHFSSPHSSKFQTLHRDLFRLIISLLEDSPSLAKQYIFIIEAYVSDISMK